jgi:hypothetical protein
VAELHSTPSLEAGQSIGEQLLPLLKFAEERCDEPIHFWAGFLSHIGGQMAASIGAEAADVIAKSVVNCTARVHQEHQDRAH